jgi:hypothetical protein
VIARYGKALEYDLLNSPMRLDLATEWRSRRWRRLLNIIEHLPRTSAYREAVAQDEDLARHMLSKAPLEESKPIRRMSDWSAEVELLTAVLDRLGEVVQAVAALGGAKPKKVPAAPRPVTAYERVHRRRRSERHRSLVARVLPHSRQERKPS